MEVANTDRKVNAALIGSAGESHAVQVAGTREFIEMLSSNLYSRPKEAMIREILCNADDAHKEAGYDGPIEITLSDDNTLSIRDRGWGIPHEKMHIIYGTYGGSTKKKDSMATGGFGLGCKSPWSYTDAFTVANCHAGTKTINSMLRVSADHGGLPAIIPLAQFDTTETGIEVRIDIRAQDLREITSLIKSMVYRGGMKATFNGEEMDAISYPEDETYKLMLGNNLGHKMMVKYGAVLYPVENQDVYRDYYENIVSYLQHGSTLILLAPPDSLVISPNRENISYLEKTQKQIWMLLREFMVVINKKAEPYALKLIRKTNESYIKRMGTGWLNPGVHSTNYLDSPVTDAAYYKMDVFSQVIHNKLTRNYPSHLHMTALRHRFKLSMPLVHDNPWKKKLLPLLRKVALSQEDQHNYHGSGGNKFLREMLGRELIKIMLRNGLDVGRMRFGSKSQFMMYNNRKWTTQPQLFTDLFHLRGDRLGDQADWIDAPVILSHTVKGIIEMQIVPENYFAYVIPRNGAGAVKPSDVEAIFKKHGLKVIDLTVNQKIDGTGTKKKTVGYPTFGFLRKPSTDKDYRGNLRLDQIHRCPKAELVEEPSVYLKAYIRGRNNTLISPIDWPDTPFTAFAHLLPDDTAVVTTEADVARLSKAGAVPFNMYLYERIAEIWADPAVRRAYAWMPISAYGSEHERSQTDLAKMLQSTWYRKTFDLPDVITNEMIKKLRLLSVYKTNYIYVHNNPEKHNDVHKIIPQMEKIHKCGEPKKLTKAFKLIEDNPILKRVIDIDTLLEFKEKTQDPKLKDKVDRVLATIME